MGPIFARCMLIRRITGWWWDEIIPGVLTSGDNEWAGDPWQSRKWRRGCRRRINRIIRFPEDDIDGGAWDLGRRWMRD